jgi:hypothetical protein
VFCRDLMLYYVVCVTQSLGFYVVFYRDLMLYYVVCVTQSLGFYVVFVTQTT